MLFYTDKMYLLEGETNICVYNDTCDDYMKSLKILYCATVPVEVNGVIINTIIGDSNFEKLDNQIQCFFLYHEIGHIKHGDIDNLTESKSKRLVLERHLGILPKMEVKADCYAASVVGVENAKYSLKWLYKNKKLPLITRLEAFRRYLKVKEVPLA